MLSLKYSRDLKNVVDTSRTKGLNKALKEGFEIGIERRNNEIAHLIKKEQFSIAQISRITGLSKEEILKL